MGPTPSVCYAFVLLQLLWTSYASFDGKITTPTIQRGALNCDQDSSLYAFTRELPSLLHNGYKSDDNLFPYYDSVIAKRYFRFRPEFEMADINTSLLLNGADQSHFYYYSGNLMQDQFAFLRAKTDIVKHVQSLVQDTVIRKKLTANVWIGKAGVQATAHYDSVHNVYIHLAGTKVLRLLPPSAVQYLQVHGRMHPYACQSRYKHLSTGDLFKRTFCVLSEACTTTHSTPTLNTDQRSNEYISQYNRDAVEIVLKPGDVLYIPPFWFHEVVAQTAALSVSLWWDAAQLDVMDIVYALPLPLESYWTADFTIRAAGIYLSDLRGAVETTLHNLPSTSNITLPALTSLIQYRYYEDWKNQYSTSENRDNTTQSDENDLSMGDTTRAELQDAANQAAYTFLTGFMTADNFASDAVLNEITTLHKFNSQCTEASAEQCVLSNQLAILQIKLMDYIEDVFLQISELILAKDCEVDVSAEFCVLYSGYQPMELAVKLLLDWASNVLYPTV